ncbi:MAG: cyclopropane fatty acyl phospholipid synthase [Deltaproteobacteria bacterium]|nr:cyclopropane fatty acyl phospholipid synthase [Deltaproteobacteria bacterium]
MFEQKIKELASQAGITINGDQPWDVQVYDKRLYRRVVLDGALGLGESYMEGWWECQEMDELFYRLMLVVRSNTYSNWKGRLDVLKSKLINLQSIKRSRKVAEIHYNLGNSFYKRMLGDAMAYSCGFWQKADDLQKAQFDKYELICRKLMLQEGEWVLDIGCGWGGLAKYMAENYKCNVVGINISEEQVKYGQEHCKGLPVTITKSDYRYPKTYNPGKRNFDKIVSVGMFEHVGPKNFQEYFRIMGSQIKKDGLFLLHTIGANQTGTVGNSWMHKYIFPEGVLPSGNQITKASEGYFMIEDWHNFGPDYDKTLMAWYRNFENYWNDKMADPEKDLDLNGKNMTLFYKMWRYYLLQCAGLFRSRYCQLWQIVFSIHYPGGYPSIRQID